MNNKTFLVLKKELREVFRDKKSLAMMLVIPIMMPIILIGVSYLFSSESEDKIDTYNKIGFAYTLSEPEQQIIDYMQIDAKKGTKEEIRESYDNEKIKAYIEKKDNNYIINYDENNPESASTRIVAENYLNQYKLYLQNHYLKDHNINSNEVLDIIKINYNAINKEQDNFYINYINTYAFLFIIMAITISSTYPATDSTAGEKERGTLETLLTFPMKSKDIILGKYLSVSLSSMITGILSFILSLFSFIYISNNIKIYKGYHIIPSIPTIIITILIIICYSLLISGLCIAVASLSKTFKEAQSKLTPITFISFFPGMISFMINLKTNFLISLTPFLNYVQIFNDINTNHYNILHISTMFISTILYIFIVLFIIIKQYKSEKVLFQ